MNNHIWVVELQWTPKDAFVPTVGVKLTRDEGREEVKRWRAKVAGAQVRLAKYAWVRTTRV